MIKAEVIKACNVHGVPRKPGDLVEVDENTFRNTVADGLLKAAPSVHTADVIQAVVVEDYAFPPRSAEPPKKRRKFKGSVQSES